MESMNNLCLDIYTDGSYVDSIPDQVTGGYIILRGDNPVIAQMIKTKIYSLVTMHNVGGELATALIAVGVACSLLAKASDKGNAVSGTLTIYHDYKGIKLFMEGNPRWKAKEPGTKFYVAGMEQLKTVYPNIKIKYVKVKAHTGIKWNEAADAIAAGVKPRDCASVMLNEKIV